MKIQSKIISFILIILSIFTSYSCCNSPGNADSVTNNNLAITEFSLNNSLALITGKDIVVTLPNDTDVTNLVATYTTNAYSVTVAGIEQTNGITINNFTHSLQYVLHSVNGLSTTYNVTVIVSSSSANEIMHFDLNFNASLINGSAGFASSDGVIRSTGVINGTNIYVNMPFGTDITKLIAKYITSASSIKVNGINQVSGVTVNDFTNPVSYVATATNGTSVTYTVHVTVSKESEKAITSYVLNGVSGVITGTSISVVVPFGTDLSSLIATYITSGVSVTVSGVTQQNGLSENNFTNPVTYTVYAKDGSSINYTVNVSMASKFDKSTTFFELNGNIGSSTGIIVGNNINVIMPFGTDLSELIATFTINGQSVLVNGVIQTSSLTINDFTSPVTYTILAADGTTTTYQINVTLASNANKAITAYSLSGIQGVITGSDINVVMPYNTDISSLVATYTTSGTSVTVNNKVQISNLSANNFTDTVQYIVKATDGSQAGYRVHVTVAKSSAKDITSFALNGILGIIVGNNITVSLPSGTDPITLIATYTTNGEKVIVNDKQQTSALTINDFTNPVTYTVMAADGSTQNYFITAIIASSTAKTITSYSLNGSPGVIVGTNIAVTVPFGSDINNLIAIFTITGVNAKIGAVTQTSSATSNNFSSPVIYTITAGDASTQNYTVTVTVALNTAKDITAFSLNGTSGVITGTNIAVIMPFGTNVNALIATYTTTGANVKIGAVLQTSGVTSNNFSSPVTYVVTAADGSTQSYVVTVTLAANPAKDITAFSLNGTSGVITGTNIAVTMPFGTDVSTLIATYTTTGVNVKVGATPQTSGATPNDFTNPVTYVVTAADGTTKNYTVTVTVAANPAKDITAFSLNGTVGTITGTNISVILSSGTITSLIATYTTTGASVKVGAITQVSGVTPNDFTNPVTYVVTAADGTTKNYVVTVTLPNHFAYISRGTGVNVCQISNTATGTLGTCNFYNIGATTAAGIAIKGSYIYVVNQNPTTPTIIVCPVDLNTGIITVGSCANAWTGGVALSATTMINIATLTVNGADYAYITNGVTIANSIIKCPINSVSGIFQTCVTAGANWSGSLTPFVINANTLRAYFTSTLNVFWSDINSTNGDMSAFTGVTVGAMPSPLSYAINNNYLYSFSQFSGSAVCPLVAGAPVSASCASNSSLTNSYKGAVFFMNVAYIVQTAPSTSVISCNNINVSNGTLSGCITNSLTGGAPVFIVVN